MEGSNKISIKNSYLNSESIRVINNLLEMDINAATAFKLSRIIKEISAIFEDKKLMESRIVNKWSEFGEDGTPKIATDENGNIIKGSVVIKNMPAFNKEMNDLESVSTELNAEKIKFEDLELDRAKIKDLMLLDFLFY
jgi:hypothetical protein